MIYSVLTEAQRAKFEDSWELDGSVSLPGVSRFRLNVSRQKNGVAAVFRVISAKIPTPVELGLMPSIVNLIDLPRGLVLVTGPTGSGKSTTLACLIEQINQKHPKKVLTIEDPIEFVYEDKQSLIFAARGRLDDQILQRGPASRDAPGPRCHPHRRDARP